VFIFWDMELISICGQFIVLVHLLSKFETQFVVQDILFSIPNKNKNYNFRTADTKWA